MPKIDFIEGIQCQKCGHIVAPITIYTKALCQKCGAKLIDISLTERNYVPSKYGEAITVKRTRKLFHNILERVE